MIKICKACGHKFQHREAILARNVLMELQNIYDTAICPACGAVETTNFTGTYWYNIHGEATQIAVTKVLSGPEFTADVLTQLKELSEQVNTLGLSLGEFEAKARNITPAASGIFRFAPTNAGELAAYIAVIITVIQTILSQMTSDKPSVTINNFGSTKIEAEQNTQIPKGSNYTAPKKARVKHSKTRSAKRKR